MLSDRFYHLPCLNNNKVQVQMTAGNTPAFACQPSGGFDTIDEPMAKLDITIETDDRNPHMTFNFCFSSIATTFSNT